MAITRLTSATGVEEAKRAFLGELAAALKATNGSDKGEAQQAGDFAQGAAIAFMRKNTPHRFYQCTDDADKVIGVMRLEVSPAEAKIANLAGVPRRGAGVLLIEFMIRMAREEGCQKAKLNANSAGLVAYYGRFGFAVDQEGALNMTLPLDR